MNYSKVEKFIKENAGEKDFTDGIDEEKISKIEQNLQVSIPESYKWFLRNYGSGGSFDIEILGHGLVSPEVVEFTKDYRELYDLPDHIVVIVDVDAFAYCLETQKMDSGECPVVTWIYQSGYDHQKASKGIRKDYGG
ncbi:SMI1/KNR4 family protein [Bacillus swezeyi]|uniref:SMI1/KNR4 family protein n=1 Tax=Bacillus swezeyi TaxID=1925020 RepID=UPI002E1E59B6|nr:SMI1/KNR4 family protein [Bacillus swezeyi]